MSVESVIFPCRANILFGDLGNYDHMPLPLCVKNSGSVLRLVEQIFVTKCCHCFTAFDDRGAWPLCIHNLHR